MAYWLFKTEPDVFSINDLHARGADGEVWDGVRNYQARNFMRDQAKIGDKVFIYHSSCKHVGIAGIASIIETQVIDPSQFDQTSQYFDEKSTQDEPRWICVKVAFEQKLPRLISLQRLKAHPDLVDMPLLKKGSRLSVMPISAEHWQAILAMA
ncbi:EVE domain-containing protein [Thalassotalea maritima]|uniref:EVE domain-containing protein n=1 Tax=Thalassotalea maritima TaxID=3242416 RepID=UPI00352813DF